MLRTSLQVGLLLILLIASLAAPALASTVYVPWTTSWTNEGAEIVATVRITNHTAEERSHEGVFLPAGESGLEPSGIVVSRTLAPYTTEIFKGDILAPIAPTGQWGLLEIVSDDGIQVTAHLSGTGTNSGRLGVDLPVASSQTLTPANETVALQGVRRLEETILTDLMVVNLTAEQAFCQVEMRRSNGTLDGDFSLQAAPLSLEPIVDVMPLAGRDNGAERSLLVTCDRDAFIFALRRDLRNGDTLVTLPGSRSVLQRPEVEEEFECPTGTLFARPGDFHTPAPGGEIAKFKIFQPGLQFSQIEFEMDFTISNWSPTEPDGNHSIFWLHRGQENQWAGNVFGYLNAFGPGKDLIRLGTNITHDISPQLARSLVLHPGRTYHVKYIYNTETALIRATVSEDGQEIGRISDDRTSSTINTGNLGMFLIFGHPEINAGPEVPTYGWTYSNLCVTAQ